MNKKLGKVLGPGLVVGGGALLYFGYQAHQSMSSRLTEAVTGNPSDKAMYLLIGGAVALLVGLGMTGVGFKGGK